MRKGIIFFIALALMFFITLLPPIKGLPIKGQRALAIALMAAILWITEAIPFPVTSLLIALSIPLFNVYHGSFGQQLKLALYPFADKVIFLFIAGFLLATSLSKHNLDKRIALFILSKTGNSPSMIILGIMVITAILSAWISNTATAALMLPITMGIISTIGAKDTHGNFAKAMMIGMAYAASIGGIATPAGSPPNPIAMSFLSEISHIDISFMDWMLAGLPIAMVLLPFSWYALLKLFPIEVKSEVNITATIQREGDLDKSTPGQKRAIFIFLSAVLLWVIEPVFRHIGLKIVGWTYLVALLVSVALFVPGLEVITWKEAERGVDWGTIILFGGGLSLGKALFESKAAIWIAHSMFGFMVGMNPLLVMTFLATFTIALHLFTSSNTATASMLVPLVIALAFSTKTDPRLYAMPVAIACSFAFWLPVNTPPNAIAYSSGCFSIKDMLKSAILINIISILVFALVTSTIWRLLKIVTF